MTELTMIARFRVPEGMQAEHFLLSFLPDIIAEPEEASRVLALRWCDRTRSPEQKMGVLCDRAMQIVPGIEFERITGYVTLIA